MSIFLRVADDFHDQVSGFRRLVESPWRDLSNGISRFPFTAIANAKIREVGVIRPSERALHDLFEMRMQIIDDQLVQPTALEGIPDSVGVLNQTIKLTERYSRSVQSPLL